MSPYNLKPCADAILFRWARATCRQRIPCWVAARDRLPTGLPVDPEKATAELRARPGKSDGLRYRL